MAKTGSNAGKEHKVYVSLRAEEVYGDSCVRALKACEKKGLVPLFLPEMIDAFLSSPEGPMRGVHWYSPSVKMVGTTPAGNRVSVYAHVPTDFSDSRRISLAQRNGSVAGGLIRVPTEEFRRVLDMDDGKNVIVTDFVQWRTDESYTHRLQEAMSHPDITPFFRGKEWAGRILGVRSLEGRTVSIHRSMRVPDDGSPYAVPLVHGSSPLTFGEGVFDPQDGCRYLGVKEDELLRFERYIF